MSTFDIEFGTMGSLRSLEYIGSYHYCGYNLENTTFGTCSNTTFPLEWKPSRVILADAAPKYFVQVNQFIVDPLRNENFYGTLCRFTGVLLILSTVTTVLVIPL